MSSKKQSLKPASPWPLYAILGGLALSSVVRIIINFVTGMDSPWLITVGYVLFGAARIVGSLAFLIGIAALGYRYIRILTSPK